MSLCRINDLKVIGRGSDTFPFILAFRLPTGWFFSALFFIWNLLYLTSSSDSVDKSSLRTSAVTQEAAAALNQWTHAHWRQTWQRKQTLFFFWCFQELRRAFLPSEIFDKLPEALHRQSKMNECRVTAEIASKLPPLGILSLLWCRVAVIAAELDSLQIIIHIHTYRQFGISH